MKVISSLLRTVAPLLPLSALAIAMSLPVTASAGTRSVTRTGPNGQTITHDRSVNYDAADKTITRNSSTTGPNGGSTSSTGTITKTADGSTRTSSFTGLNGQTTTEQVTRVRSSTGN